MTRRELERSIAAATGEDLSEVRRLGFGLMTRDPVDRPDEADDLPPKVVDWDELEKDRDFGDVEIGTF